MDKPQPQIRDKKGCQRPPRQKITEEFADKVREYRQTRGISVLALSATIGRKGNFIHYLESRKTKTTTQETYSVLSEIIEEAAKQKDGLGQKRPCFRPAVRKLRHKYLVHIASFCADCADYAPQGCDAKKGDALMSPDCPLRTVNTMDKRDFATHEQMAAACVAMCACCATPELCFDCPLALLRDKRTRKRRGYDYIGKGRIFPPKRG